MVSIITLDNVLKSPAVSPGALQLAGLTFAGDCKIVGAKERFVDWLGEPHGHGTYTVTQPYNIHMVRQTLRNRPTAVVVGCMDKRGAQRLWQQVRQMYPRHAVISLFQAGGIVQQELERQKSLQIMLSFIAQNAHNLTAVVATGHDGRCGYIAHSEGQGVPEQLGVLPGHEREQHAMMIKIATSARRIVPTALRSRTELYLAHFGSDANGLVELRQVRPSW